MSDLPSIEKLRDLRDRVESALGADKALSREIQCEVGGWHRVIPSHHKMGKGPRFIHPNDWCGAMSNGAPVLDGLHGTDMYMDVPHVTSSVDAALELAVKTHPGKWLDISGPRKYLDFPSPVPGRWRVVIGDQLGWAETLPLAIMSATLNLRIANAMKAEVAA